MNSSDSARQVIEALNHLDIVYMIVGSFSSNAYGIARATLDADFVIETDRRINDLRDALAPHFAMDPQVGFETTLLTTKYAFRHRETHFAIEVFVLSEDAHDRERFQRRQRVMRDELVTYFQTAEDVIIQKLRWGRPKDRLDITDVIAVRGDKLDWTYIHRWCDEHHTRKLLDEIHQAG